MADASQDPFDPSAALAAMRQSRERLNVQTCPPWRHALFAGLMSGVVAAQAAPIQVFFALLAATMALTLAVFLVTRARKGVFINGWRAGATRGVAAAIYVVYLAIYMITWFLKTEARLWAAPLVGAAILFPLAYYASVRWMQVYRRELAA